MSDSAVDVAAEKAELLGRDVVVFAGEAAADQRALAEHRPIGRCRSR